MSTDQNYASPKRIGINSPDCLTIHENSMASPKRRLHSSNYRRGKKTCPNIKRWRESRSTSPKHRIRITQEGSNTKIYARKLKDISLKENQCLIENLYDKLLQAVDSAHESKRMDSQKANHTSATPSQILTSRDDTTEEDICLSSTSLNNLETMPQQYSHGNLAVQSIPNKSDKDVPYQINSNNKLQGISFPEIPCTHIDSCAQCVTDNRGFAISNVSSLQSDQRETIEYDYILNLQESHQQEIIELKKTHELFVKKIRDFYQQREKEQEQVLRKLDYDIKLMRQEMDLLQVSSQQSLDSIRLCFESNCKALQYYVAEETAEAKQETQSEYYLMTDRNTASSSSSSIDGSCARNNIHGQLQNDDVIENDPTLKQASVPLSSKSVESPVPTLPLWFEFVKRFRSAISGDADVASKIGRNLGHTTGINTTRFIEEISFQSHETYYDAEC